MTLGSENQNGDSYVSGGSTCYVTEAFCVPFLPLMLYLSIWTFLGGVVVKGVLYSLH